MGQKARMELILDCAEPKRLARFWLEALDYRNYYTDTNLAVLIPKEGTASPLLLQGVPEAKACKNRMHLDIVVDDIEVEVHRLEALGAHRIDKEAQRFGGTRLVRMSDPEQNELVLPETTSASIRTIPTGRPISPAAGQLQEQRSRDVIWIQICGLG